MDKKILRCAVYTRKSTEEGLQQDFNSLQAQREACEAYITSQKHEGWQIVKQHYDDGGFSGGNMQRPGLQMLLKDIETGKVNVVVVYKVDRLTRSLMDFAKIIEQFDKRGVFFVSVTQSFNTTSSMGRLTLNVLLSFAQFEREVTGERIRDKIAASKQKGMFMGGNVPLGYKVDKRKLHVVPEDAETVRYIFRQYLELGCIRLLHDHLRVSGIRSRTGKTLSRGNLRNILHKRIYIGEITHKGKSYPGLHEGIIDQELWDKVHRQFGKNRLGVKGKHSKATAAPLAGKLFGISGERLVPVYSRKNGRRYRYYVSESLTTGPAAQSPNAWRLPGTDLENNITQTIRRMLDDRKGIIPLLQKSGVGAAYFAAVFSKTDVFRARLASQEDKDEALAELLERVDVHQDGLKIKIHLSPLLGKEHAATKPTMTHEVAMRMPRRGIESKLVISGNENAIADPVLIRAIARGRVWFDEFLTGQVRSMGDIAKKYILSDSHIGNLLPLAFLAPDIVEAILLGRQPTGLTLEQLTKHVDLPIDWEGQRRTIETLLS